LFRFVPVVFRSCSGWRNVTRRVEERKLRRRPATIDDDEPVVDELGARVSEQARVDGESERVGDVLERRVAAARCEVVQDSSRGRSHVLSSKRAMRRS
jgi:hypothetical protein